MLPIIEVNNLSKRYRIGEKQPYYSFRDSLVDLVKAPFKQKNKVKNNTFWALKDISFKVMPGEVIGIIGRNGAGKSTLLKILSRITPTTKGEITLRGRVASLLEVGTGFHPELTGRENIYLNGAILGMKRTEINDKFDEIVEFAEISKFLDTPVKFYSSGMYMRLAFAIAAHLDPEILLVDEVLAVGDVQFQKKCLGKMKEVSKQGRTVLFVSHNMTAIQNLCKKAILLKTGKIVYSGNARDTIKKYLTEMGNFNIKKKLEWTALEENYPFSKIVRIKRFYIIDNKNKIPKGRLFNSKNYKAVIEADLIQNNASLVFSLAFYDDSNNLLFVSNMCDTGEINFSQMELGPIRLSIPIPIGLLGNKTYKIELVSCLEKIGWILPFENESILTFDFFKDINLNPYTYSDNTTPGFFAPVLKWEIKYE